MASFDSTPNIGLKNIKIGSAPWGAEERENKIILDSVLANISANGKLKIALHPRDAVTQSDTAILTTIGNLPCIKLLANNTNTLSWYISAAETYEYIASRTPYQSTCLLTGAINTNIIYSNIDPSNEILMGDTVTILSKEYIVNSVVDNAIVINGLLELGFTDQPAIVTPNMSNLDRIMVEVCWFSHATDKPGFCCSLNKVTTELPTIVPNHYFDATSLGDGKVNTCKVVFSPTEDELVSGKASIFSLVLSNALTSDIEILGVSITLGRAKSIPTFISTYYNIYGTEGIEPQHTDYVYDEQNRLIKCVEQLYGEICTTEFVYLNNLITQQIETYKGIITTITFTYDSFGNMVSSDSVVTLA